MKSWKIRLGLMLTMLAMLLAVSVPAAAQDYWVEYAPGECWVDEWGSTWCPWDPSLVAPVEPAAVPVSEHVAVDEDEDDFATIESELDDFEDFFEDLEDLEEDFCDEDDEDCDDGDFVNALFDDDDDDCDDDDDGDCDDDDDHDDDDDDEDDFERIFF